jgi:micrococcal nuclease
MNEVDKKTGVVTPSYIYRAVTVSVYDGDTITADVDLGLGVWVHGQKLRLYGINAPEVRGEERVEGLASRDALRAMLPTGKSIVIATKRDKKGKYGRWLAEVYYTTYQNPGGPMMSANEALVKRGLAKRATY